MDVVIQHWLVAVARNAGLDGADELDVPSDAAPGAAWDVVTLRLGISPEELAERVAEHYGLPVADLDAVEPHAYRLLPARVARRWTVLPLGYSDRQLLVATADPVSLEAERAVGAVSGRSVQFAVAPPSHLEPAVEATYPDAEPVHTLPPLDVTGRGGPRILVVDDADDMRLLLRSALEDEGFRVVEATDGGQALEVLGAAGAEDPVHLVTLDLAMPGVDGLSTLEAIREAPATRDLPVIVATGMDDPEVEIQLFESGADDYVVKPVDPPRFLMRVKAVLRRRGGGEG